MVLERDPHSQHRKMKVSTIALLGMGLMTSCDRENSIRVVDHHRQNAITASMPWSIRGETDALISSRIASSQESTEALAKLRSMAPRILEEDVLIYFLEGVPVEELPRFTNLVFEAVKMLAPRIGQSFDSKYESAIRLAERVDPRKLAPLVYEHLDAVPPYDFPTFELPGGWGDASLAQHACKGTQGVIATIVVQYGDSELMDRYRNQMKTASPQLQRVMAWALSRSLDPEDFELLWQLHARASDPAFADTVKRALSVVPRTLRSAANGNEVHFVNRTGMSVDEMRSRAESLRERLEGAMLSTPLTIWD